MSDFPSPVLNRLNNADGFLGTITTLGGMQAVSPASTAWPAANLAIFVPIVVRQQCIVYKLAVGAGATAAGNFDVGLYDRNGNLLVSSGATAKGASVEHVIDVTDTTIGPGLYYLALSADGTNNYVMITPSGTSPVPLQKARLFGTLQAASAYVLPSTVTMVARNAAPYPVIGAFTRSY